MDFVNYSEMQNEIVNLAMDFSKKEIKPKAAELDQQGGGFPVEIHKKAHDLGLLQPVVEEKYGGAGLGYLDFILITEKLAWGCAGVAGAISLNNMIADCLMVAGSDEQKSEYLTRLAAGEIGGYAMTEPEAGSNVAGIKTTAIKKGDRYILNGSKTWISNAEVASFFIVFAKTDMNAGSKGISAFIVERNSGMKIGQNLPKLGQKSFPAAELFFENIEVDESKRLGKEGEGFLIAMKVFDRSRPMVAAVGVGLSQRCLDESLEYASTRESMGKPIIIHQMVAQKVAEMGMRTEAARLLTYKSTDLLDQNRMNTLNASYAKCFAADTAVWSANEAVQVFGGMGYSTEYPVEKLYRDSKVLQIYEGTNEIQRIIMARELTKERTK